MSLQFARSTSGINIVTLGGQGILPLKGKASSNERICSREFFPCLIIHRLLQPATRGGGLY